MTKEEIRSEAERIGVNLNYKPDVQMYDIRLLPDSFWHESRTTGWGGSNEGDLNGMGYNGIEELAYEKILGLAPKVNNDTQFIFDFGHAMEWVMLKRYAAINGYKFLTYINYFVIVKSKEDIRIKYPEFKLAMEDVYSFVTQNKALADKTLDEVIKDYPEAFIEAQESQDPKDVRDITEEEHKMFDSYGIVCVDRRQYRHPLYHSMLGDVDGLCITPDGEKIGLECKTYGHLFKGTFSSGVLNETGTVKNPEYPLQVQHYMNVLNLNRFDILGCCGNNPNDFTVTTVYRDVELGEQLAQNCEKTWKQIEEGIVPKTNGLLKTDSFNKIMEIVNADKTIKKERVQLNSELLENIEEIEKLSESIDAKKKEKEVLEEKKNELVLSITKAMDGNETGFIPNKNDDFDYEVAFKGRETTRMDEKSFKINHPDLWEEYKKKTLSSPTFTFKRKYRA